MSEHPELKELLGGKVLLVDCDAGECKLLERAEAVKRMMDADDPWGAAVMIDVAKCLASFARLAGADDRTFTVADLQKVMAMPYASIDNWVGKRLIVPSVRAGDGGGRGKERLFAWRDAFVAGLLASLRRQGVPMPMLRKVVRMFATARVEA